jgi:hypothetical protein
LTPHRPSAGAVVGDDGTLTWPAIPDVDQRPRLQGVVATP